MRFKKGDVLYHSVDKDRIRLVKRNDEDSSWDIVVLSDPIGIWSSGNTKIYDNEITDDFTIDETCTIKNILTLYED